MSLGVVCPPAARAQSSSEGSEASDDELSLERIVAGVADLLFSLADSGSEKVFQFLETVELFDFEREIDRLVGDPRTLNDSTAYKLGLLPFHIRFPIYQQLVRQMTRQDDLRSRRIHQVTPDAVNVIALRIGALAEDDVRQEVRASLTKHFNAREVADLGFFILAQQRFFPDTDEGWQHWKRSMADAGPEIAAVALMTGAAFDVASLSRSGTIARLFDRRLRAGLVRRLQAAGDAVSPDLPGGPDPAHAGPGDGGRAVAGGARPTPGSRSRPGGGGAGELVQPPGPGLGLGRVLRGGVPVTCCNRHRATRGRSERAPGVLRPAGRDPGWKHYGLRFSAESETDFQDQVRFAVGFGVEHSATGLTTMVQASRSARPGDRLRLADTRAGIFIAGTMEPLTGQFVEDMRSHSRLVSDDWEMIRTLERRRRRTSASWPGWGRRAAAWRRPGRRWRPSTGP